MLKQTSPSDGLHQNCFKLTVLIAGLGYFVDTFDFFLYNSMRVVSLTELGLSGDALTKAGMFILNCQILGTLLGGFFWGIIGDKLGRKKALIGSILVYSIFMVATGFVHDTIMYGFFRFIVGFGVAGEVGLGATLVAETVRSEKRTYALMLFTVMGVFGVVFAAVSIEFVSWRTSCFVGGGLGLILLTLRSILFKSRYFIDTAIAKVRRGSLRDLFGNWRHRKKYILCVPIMSANFLVIGVLLTLTPEIAKATGTQGVIKANIALAVYFAAAAFGDWLSAWLSDRLKSRRLVGGLFILGNAALAFLLVQPLHLGIIQFYGVCAAFGLFNLWAISGTILVEQFPTELRATASTSNINCARATVVLMNVSLLYLKPHGFSSPLMLIGAVVFSLGLLGVWRLSESYNRSLSDR